jgi:hypothetical protein
LEPGIGVVSGERRTGADVVGGAKRGFETIQSGDGGDLDLFAGRVEGEVREEGPALVGRHGLDVAGKESGLELIALGAEVDEGLGQLEADGLAGRGEFVGER